MTSCCTTLYCVLGILCCLILVCRESSAVCTTQQCFPASWDLTELTETRISANSTCGLSGAEDFCVKSDCNNQCDNSTTADNHNAKLAIDKYETKTYWKSKNKEENVVIQLDLGHSYFFREIFVTFKFDYPAAMYVAKSDDHGKTWKTLTYFSTDCTKFFNMVSVEENNRNGFAIECIKIDTAALTPGQEPKVSYSPWRDNDFSSSIVTNHTLQQEFLATNFRVVLVKFRTPSDYDPNKADSRNFYFSVQDWQIDGHCYCNGLSDECDGMERWKCSCSGNTTGDNCDQCLPLFNNVKYEEGKPCQACECSNHSSSCVFDETKNHGVCQNCTGYTTGDACEKCLPKYYNDNLPLKHPESCQACNCHLPGVKDGPASEACNQTTGQCDCKGNVTGRMCDQCKDEYWNMRADDPFGCQGCHCPVAGTVNASNVCEKTTGQCPCRDHFGGRTCTECAEGYYGLTRDRPMTCKDCFCSLIGSVNSSCDQDTGHCYCHDKFSDVNCSTLARGSYVPNILDMTYLPHAPGAVVRYNETSDIASVVISGTSLSQQSRTVTFDDVEIPRTAKYTPVVRYETTTNWPNILLKIQSLTTPFQPYQCQGMPPITDTVFTFTEPFVSSVQVVNYGDICLGEGQYIFSLVVPLVSSPPPDPTIDISFLSVYPHPANLESPVADNKTLALFREATTSSSYDPADGSVELGRLFTRVFGSAKSCSCNATGSSNATWCDPNNGQCMCRPNVDGKDCDRCKPTFYSFTTTGCQACNCDPVGSIDGTCDVSTGQCRCKSGATGKQCTSCKTNYYGFASGAGCQPCGCDLHYSTNPQCYENGTCACQPGVEGERCNMGCNDVSFNLTLKGCDPCNCDPHGSSSLTCNKTSGRCLCKAMAVGMRCDSCPKGYHYGLSEYHPTGCLKCDCSGKTVNCSSKRDMYETFLQANLEPTNPRSVVLDGWAKTAGNGKIEVSYQFFFGAIRGVMRLTAYNGASFYYNASQEFLGEKLLAYQHYMKFYLWLDKNDNPYNTTEGDVILTGKWFNQSLVYKFSKRPSTEESMFEVFLGEQGWTVGDTNGRPVESYEMRAVLSHVTSLYIRAKWNDGIDEQVTYLSMVKMYYSAEYQNQAQIPDGARLTKSVEECVCPREFIGDSCQYCAPGYTRQVPNTGPYSPCVLCSCNGNSEKCHRDTGVCIDCRYNTSGDHCEKCALGYYGNASLSTPDACQPCMCFGGHKSCDLLANESFACNCDAGYTGLQCESCSVVGYWGTPTEDGGRCTTCDCNNNSPTCDKATGNCSSTCQDNTTGFNCEWCQPGYWGNATKQTCQVCSCSSVGSEHNICDNVTGECVCKKNVKPGRSCSECLPDHWGFQSGTGCTFCDCSEDGAVNSQCNLTSGVCSCQGNATGPMCDQCHAGLYDVSMGCIACGCNLTYSMNDICNSYTGQCECRRSSEGGRYGGRQCTLCAWDAVGTFPLCAQCNETCYENWYQLIGEERAKVAILGGNITDLWTTFNESTVEEINQTLIELNSKLEESEEIFRGANFSTEKKENDFKKLNETMLNLRQQLDDANRTLSNISLYLNNIAAPFNGSVDITSENPPVQASYVTIRAWAEEIRLQITNYNRTAYEDYQKIINDYQQIQSYNASGSQVVAQIEMAVNDLDEVDKKIQEITSILDRNFYDNVEDNNQKLEQLKKDSEEIRRVVDESRELTQLATQRLNYAQGNISEAESVANNNLEESSIIYQRSLAAEKEANNALKLSQEFLTNSTSLLNTVNDSISDVTKSIGDMALAKEKTENATSISEGVLAMSVPVDIQTIAALSAEILTIPVNETLVNATLEDATASLKIADEARRRSQLAKNISQETLSEVKEIEQKIQLAAEYHTNITNLLNGTDNMVKEIEENTSEISSEFTAARETGEATLGLLDDAINDINKNLTCFNESHEMAVNAANMAELAYKKILNASKMINESTDDLNEIEPELQNAHQVAVKSYRDILETNQHAIKLHDDIKEAEQLLQNYIVQRDEMDALEEEIMKYEKTLQDVNTDLDLKLKEYESCGSN